MWGDHALLAPANVAAGMNDLLLFPTLIVALIDSFCHARLANKIDASLLLVPQRSQGFVNGVFFLCTLDKNVIIECVNSAEWVLYASGRVQWEFYLQCRRA